MVATPISLSVGLAGVTISLFLGVLLGGLSGYYGGAIDNIIQRIIEFLRSIPSIPLRLGLAAALPPDWSPIRIYFAITIILSIVGWTGLARVVRGRFLSLREEDFVMAAKLDGIGEMSIILRYMLPSFLSHIIASITLAIPRMILAETSLSFLGLGLRPPVVSWGVLLKEAQNVRAVATAPWLLLAAVPVIISVLVLNFLGDGTDLACHLRKRFPHAPPIVYKKHVGSSVPWRYVLGWAEHVVVPEQPDLVLLYGIGLESDLEKIFQTLRRQTTADIIVASVHWKADDVKYWGKDEEIGRAHV